jgi:hypothetical protein
MEFNEEKKFVNSLFNNNDNILPNWAIIFPSNTSIYTISNSFAMVNSISTPIPQILNLLFIIYNLLLNSDVSDSVKKLYNRSFSKELEELSKGYDFSLKEIHKDLQTEELCLNLIKFNHLYYYDIKSELKSADFNIKCMLQNKKILSIIDIDENIIIENINYLDLSYIQSQTYTMIIEFLNKDKDFIKSIKSGVLSKHEWEYIKLKYFI